MTSRHYVGSRDTEMGPPLSLSFGVPGWHVDEYGILDGNRDPALRSGFQKNMVEAVGVEPTSENVTGQEPTYLVQFTRRELPRQIRVVRLERTRNAKR